MGSHRDEDWSLLTQIHFTNRTSILPQSCLIFQQGNRGRKQAFHGSSPVKHRTDTRRGGMTRTAGGLQCWEPAAGATDLSVQVDICNTVQGKFVSVGPVFVDVGDGQTRQLPHSFVIAGYGRQFDRRQGKTVGAQEISAGQKKEAG